MSSYEIEIEGVTFGAGDVYGPTLKAYGCNFRECLYRSVPTSREGSEPIHNPTGLQADAIRLAESLVYELVPFDGRTLVASVVRITKDGRRTPVGRACSWLASAGVVGIDSPRASRLVRIGA